MKYLLKLEEAAMFVAGIYLLLPFALPWWLLVILFFAPDLGALGYLAGTKVGAFTYNLLHHKGIGVVLYGLGLYLASENWQIAGLTIFAHSSFDRIWGFGLKYTDSFTNSHLGMIGKTAEH